MSNTIRIAQIMGKMENGGVESVVMNYYRHIDRNKIQFDFIVDADSSVPQRAEIESLGGRVIEVPPYQKIEKYIKSLKKVFKENNYKIVHSHLNTLSVFPLYAAKRAGVPVRIAHNHSTAGKGEHKKNVLKYMLRPFAKLYPTHLAACSEYAGDWLFGKGAVGRGEVTVFNNAIDLDKFRFNKEVRDSVRKELGVEESFVVGHVGRFCYQKNHEFLIDIFDEIRKRRKDSVLLLIGEGGLMADVKKQAAENGLKDCVRFLGNRTDVNRLYQAMDVFVLPSRYEGLGMVAVEAQIAGVKTYVSTELPDDVAVSNGIEFIDLSDKAENWAKPILSEKQALVLDERSKAFDIKIAVKSLEDYYFSL